MSREPERISTLALFGLMMLPLWIIAGIISIIQFPEYALMQLGMLVPALYLGLTWGSKPRKGGQPHGD